MTASRCFSTRSTRAMISGFFEGDEIPMFTWAFTGDLCNLYDFALPFDFYGALYSHAAITSGKLAPEGWRIPNEQDFVELENFVAKNGHSDNPAAALRGVGDWKSPLETLDAFGFRALPAGYAGITGNTTGAPAISIWTTSESFQGQFELMRKTVSIATAAHLILGETDARFGNSVRCVKDAPPLLIGDINCDGSVDLLDVQPFVELLGSGTFVQAADINQDGFVNLLDVAPFVDLLNGN